MLIQTMADLGLPPMESLSVEDARAFMQAIEAVRPPGREVGEVVDGVLPGAAGPLAYRLYRPAGEGPHPLVAYFHGGGMVLGSLDSDDPFCRDLCLSSHAVVVSVNYRHAPEARFPAAVDDGFAAVQWIASHAVELGGLPGHLAVAGWSAGANIAAVACQLARNAGGPDIVGQLLLTPVTDGSMSTPSYEENGLGYVLTAPLMQWFWDHYADPADRSRPEGIAAAGRSVEPSSGPDRHRRVRSAARRGQGLRRSAGRRGGASRAARRPGPDPHVLDHDRRDPVERRSAGPDGRGPPGLLPGGRPSLTGDRPFRPRRSRSIRKASRVRLVGSRHAHRRTPSV